MEIEGTPLFPTTALNIDSQVTRYPLKLPADKYIARNMVTYLF